MEKEQITEKIRKLLRLAESPNEHEAALAAARAQELMEKYQIATLEEQFKTNVEDVGIEAKCNWDKWYEVLFLDLAKSCDLQPYARKRDGKRTLSVIGLKSDVEVFQHLWAYLTSAILKLQKADWRIEKAAYSRALSTRAYANRHRKAFCLGAAQRVGEMVRERKTARAEADQQTKALVVRKADQINEYLKQSGRNFTRPKTRRQNALRAEYVARGYQQGGSISINRAIR